MRIPSVLMLALMLAVSSPAQHLQPYPKLSQPEQKVLELLNRDTVTTTTIRFNDSYHFGIPGTSNGMAVAKSRKLCYFLPEGTQEVWIPDPEAPAQRLKRIDSSMFSGSNFGAYPFIRHDTLFSIGGYGFWQVRGFITYYIPDRHEWEYYPAAGEQMTMGNIAQRSADDERLFIASTAIRNPDMPGAWMPSDSVSVFRWGQRRWETIGFNGPIREEFINAFESNHIWNADWGAGYLSGYERLCLFDFENNAIHELKEGPGVEFVTKCKLMTSHRERIKMFSLFVLQDSIYYLAGDQNVVNVQAMYLNRSSFSDSVWKPVYRPLEPGKDVSAMSGSSIWKAFPWALCLLLFGYILLRRNGRRKPPAIPQAADPGSDPDTVPLNREQRVAAFMAALSETEREFLRELIRISLQDQRMDIPVMNKLLGVANKDIEIQKSRRSITINNINDLYTKICREPGLVVKKERSEFDKRSFLYYCDTATINILVNHLE